MEIDQFVHKGLQQDSDPHLQAKDSYRDALNGYLISAGNDQFIFTTADGNKLSFRLASKLVNHQPIGWVEGLTRLYIFSTNDSSESGGEGGVSRIDINQETGIGITANTFAQLVYVDSNLKFTTKHIIGREAVIISESEKIERLYWTDNFNNPRALNVSDDNVGSINVKLTDFVPNKLTGIITLETVDPFHNHALSGKLVSGVYRYTYRLRSSAVSVQSTWSQLSIPIFINPEDVGGNLNVGSVNNAAIQYQKFQGGSFDEVTSKAVSIQIIGIDQVFDEIEVAVFFYDGVDINPNGTIFVRTDVTSSAMFFEHQGGENLGFVTPVDLLVTESRIDTVATLASNENRLIIGNITETTSLDLSKVASGIKINTFLYKVPSEISRIDKNSPLVGTPAALEPSGVGPEEIRRGSWYQVRGGSARFPALGGVVINDGGFHRAVISGTSVAPGFGVVSGNPKVFAMIRIQKFGDFEDTNDNKYHNIQVSSDWYDHKGVAASGYLRSHWRGETYREGILIYDDKGRPSFVQWIDDIKMPEQFENTNRTGAVEQAQLWSTFSAGPFSRESIELLGLVMNNIDLTSLLDQLGIGPSGTNEPERLPEFVSGFQLVRAPRDESILAQGMLWPTQRIASSSLNAALGFEKDTVFPMSWPGFTGNKAGYNTVRNENSYLFHSPDHLFNHENRFPDTTNPTIPAGQSLKIVDYLSLIQSVDTPLTTQMSPFENHDNIFVGVTAPSGATAKGIVNKIRSLFNIQLGVINLVNWNPFKALQRFTNKVLRGPSYLPNFSQAQGKVDRDGAGVKSAVIVTENGESQASGFGDTRTGTNINPPLVNIVKTGTNPYGGQGKGSLANTNYITIGHFQPINLDIYNLNGKSWVFNNVEVWGGDCFVNIFDIARISPDGAATAGLGVSAIFACESNLNMALRQGRHVAKDGFIDNQNATDGSAGTTNPDGISFASPIRPEEFIYNKAYSHITTNVLYPAVPLDLIVKKRFINRARHSLVKIPNEPIDNFRIFLIENKLEVDIKDGGINNLRIRGERMFYWQDRANGYLPINERALVNDSFGQPIQLGVGGVLTRYDERTDFYGNQHRHGLVDTADGFAWIDRNNRALLNLNDSGNNVELSTVKGVMSFIDLIVKSVPGDNPVDGTGINGIYCSRTKNTYMTFKSFKESRTVIKGTFRPGQAVGGVQIDSIQFVAGTDLASFSAGDTITISFFDRRLNEQSSVDVKITSVATDVINIDTTELQLGQSLNELDSIEIVFVVSELDNGATISFNHLKNEFIGFHPFVPSMYMRFKDYMFTSAHKAPTLLNLVLVNVGDVYTSTDGANYVCFLSFISSGVQPENDLIHFKKANTLDAIYVHDEGDLARHYGIVNDTIIELVINPEITLDKVFDNVKINSGANAFTRIEYSTSDQFASDNNIDANPEYEFRNKAWYGTVATESDGRRLQDFFMIVRMIKDNKLNGDPTKSSNEKIKMLSLKTTYRKSY